MRGGARPGAGAKKGVPRKPRRELLALLRDKWPDYHPVVEMARIAHNPETPLDLQAQMHKEVAQYVQCKLKAVDHTFGGETHMEVVVDIVPHDK